jgi:hypothetical protein
MFDHFDGVGELRGSGAARTLASSNWDCVHGRLRNETLSAQFSYGMAISIKGNQIATLTSSLPAFERRPVGLAL